MLTRDQLKMLATDNVVSKGARGFAEFGIVPTTLDAVLSTYLYSYRPSGQYAEIRTAALNMRQK